MNKTYRQGQILRLIRNRRIHTQEQLAQELTAVGIPATQVTLSRDIRELRLVKTADGYREVQTTAGPSIGTMAAPPATPIPGTQNRVRNLGPCLMKPRRKTVRKAIGLMGPTEHQVARARDQLLPN